MAWTEAHARRLLWRAGFGPAPGEAAFWAARGERPALDWLLRGGAGPHGTTAMVGPAPIPLDAVNEWGHDGLWWLDRMVRGQRPLQEKLTLLLFDHMPVRGQETPLALAYVDGLRRRGLGSFRGLLGGVTRAPAMQAFLSLVDSDKSAPNENFARELMELFTLGHGRYSERDVREASRALTGFRGVWRDGRPLRVRFDPRAHDRGVKRIFGRRGRFGWRDVLDLCVAHPAHAPFLVSKVWSWFVTEPLDTATRRRLVRVYVRGGRRMAPLVRAVLSHPALYANLHEPAMVKWPVVQVAGMLRGTGQGVSHEHWSWLLARCGQELFEPPSVAGWDTGPAWLSTATMRGRILLATYVCREPPVGLPERWQAPDDWGAAHHVAAARAATGDPQTTPATDAQLHALADRFLRERAPDRIVQSALRHLLLSGPDAHLC